MAYTVLARKYRSRTFDEIAGQDAIATTLKNAVASGRIHHGYLFTGTRGVGKTSMARILAKALNCFAYDKPTPTPCCQCESCRLIAEGEDLDVVEIDAASNTGVDNIRDLRNNAIFRPARSRFKIYIIDEVHMLSTGAFNALLKTLEEPPDHVKFILATTESHKVPATIQSRCQRFDFRSMDIATIAAQLKKSLDGEGLPADDAVLRRVARLANGSMRDALSLLDQLLSLGAEHLTLEMIEEVLPSPVDEAMADVVDRIADNDAAGALDAAERCLNKGQTAERFCESLIEYLRVLMLTRICGEKSELVDLSGPLRQRVVEQSGRFDAPTYVYMIGLVEEVRRAVKWSSASRPLVDAAVVRLALASQFSSLESVIRRLEGEAPAEATAQSKKNAEPGRGRVRSAECGVRNVEERVPAMAAPASITPTPAMAAPVDRRDQLATASRQSVWRPGGSLGPAHASPSGVKVSSADKQKVMANPSVRRAMEVFEGSTLVEVRRVDASISNP